MKEGKQKSEIKRKSRNAFVYLLHFFIFPTYAFVYGSNTSALLCVYLKAHAVTFSRFVVEVSVLSFLTTETAPLKLSVRGT